MRAAAQCQSGLQLLLELGQRHCTQQSPSIRDALLALTTLTYAWLAMCRATLSLAKQVLVVGCTPASYRHMPCRLAANAYVNLLFALADCQQGAEYKWPMPQWETQTSAVIT